MLAAAVAVRVVVVAVAAVVALPVWVWVWELLMLVVGAVDSDRKERAAEEVYSTSLVVVEAYLVELTPKVLVSQESV